MCLEQEHKSRFKNTNLEIKKKKKLVNQNPAKSTTIHLNHPTSTKKQHSTNQTTRNRCQIKNTNPEIKKKKNIWDLAYAKSSLTALWIDSLGWGARVWLGAMELEWGAPKTIPSSSLLLFRLRSIGRWRDGGAGNGWWGCEVEDNDDEEAKGLSTSVYRSPNSSLSSIWERKRVFLSFFPSFFLERETEEGFWVFVKGCVKQCVCVKSE